jgi:hypothetical protein
MRIPVTTLIAVAFGCSQAADRTAFVETTRISAVPTATSSSPAQNAESDQADTTVILGLVERDLTGDGKPETLSVVGVGRTLDSLAVTFSIESSGRTIYRFPLAPLTRTVGFDAGRRTVSAEEHRARLKEFGPWFFAEGKFQSLSAFVDSLRVWARGRVAQIPEVIARDRQPTDSVSPILIWEDIQNTAGTIFTFSPGGDAIVAIGWSVRAQRFYRLLECC